MKQLIILLCASILFFSCGTIRQGSTEPYATSSAKTVKAPENTTYTNIYDYFRGKVPGVQVSGNSIRIRGIQSINSGSDPLILLDGIEVKDISDINPESVESVTVLKDAGSTAIYGFRGANGVIIIKTKSAQ